MDKLLSLLQMIVVVVSGAAVGHWFLSKARAGRARGEEWYRAYLTWPGLIILCALLGLPLVIWLTGR